ncbi:hypothetical protein LJC39_01875 [Parabacteroides sp. OttesenSCG-928-B22]|nr:hypothetical protein [Parabacteroides sp. OttesenSCG-928-B22]
MMSNAKEPRMEAFVWNNTSYSFDKTYKYVSFLLIGAGGGSALGGGGSGDYLLSKNYLTEELISPVSIVIYPGGSAGGRRKDGGSVSVGASLSSTELTLSVSGGKGGITSGKGGDTQNGASGGGGINASAGSATFTANKGADGTSSAGGIGGTIEEGSGNDLIIMKEYFAYSKAPAKNAVYTGGGGGSGYLIGNDAYLYGDGGSGSNGDGEAGGQGIVVILYHDKPI